MKIISLLIVLLATATMANDFINLEEMSRGEFYKLLVRCENEKVAGALKEKPELVDYQFNFECEKDQCESLTSEEVVERRLEELSKDYRNLRGLYDMLKYSKALDSHKQSKEIDKRSFEVFKSALNCKSTLNALGVEKVDMKAFEIGKRPLLIQQNAPLLQHQNEDLKNYWMKKGRPLIMTIQFKLNVIDYSFSAIFSQSLSLSSSIRASYSAAHFLSFSDKPATVRPVHWVRDCCELAMVSSARSSNCCQRRS